MNAHISFEYIPALVPLTTGVSNPSEAVRRLAEKAYEHFTKPVRASLPNTRLVSALYDIAERCRDPNWDGYDAAPISDESILSALEFLSNNLGKFKLPEATPEPDGELALEWYGNAGAVFSMSFGSQKKINYAGLFANDEKVHGNTNDFSEASQLVSHFISKLQHFPRTST